MPRAPVYPLFLNLAGQPVLVVGGGVVGLRKAEGLLESGARVTVVSPAFADAFRAMPLRRVRAAYAGPHMKLESWRLVFAATDVTEVNARVRNDAAAAGIFCSRADDPEDSDFAGGAHIRVGVGKKREPVATFAVSTAGASPVLAGRLCREAAANVDPTLIQLADLLIAWRAQVKRVVKEAAPRRALLQRLAGEEMETILREHGAAAAQKLFRQWLTAAARSPASSSGNARGKR